MKVLLLVATLVAITTAQSTFRQLSARELREIELRHDPELLRTVARTAETVIIVLDSALTGAFVQEGVNANIDCFPWLSNFPGGQITWLTQRFIVDQETGVVEDVEDQTEIQTTDGGRFIIGGPFDRWLNITATNIIQGREDADHGNYTCRVCVGQGTPFEECHDATVTVYLPGAPPMINDTEGNVPDDVDPVSGLRTYRIGADFCIERGMDIPFRLECDILERDLANGIPGPRPTPLRTFVKDGVVVYNATQGLNPVENLNDEFVMANMILVPGQIVPQVFLATVDGSITFLTQVGNSSGAGIPESVARDMLFDIYTGEWTCTASNAYGSDTATTNIRECGLEPVIGDCPVSSGVIFPGSFEVVSVACDTICIREGTSVTLNCTVIAGDPPINYRWFDGQGIFLSNLPLLTVNRPDNYTCDATNLDAPENREVALLSFSPRLSYTGVIADEISGLPRGDNGCGRLSVEVNASVCVFVGETLTLECGTDDGTQLDIIDLGGTSQGGNFTIMSTEDNIAEVEGTFECLLSNIDGPCGEASRQLNVQVFDPARIDRESDLGTTPPSPQTFGVGRSNQVEVVTANTTVTLLCPTTGIPTPMDSWRKVTLNQFGMAMETVITGEEPGFTITPDSPMAGTLQLTIDNFFGSDEGTYVCRTSNIAGQDADSISLTTQSTTYNWQVGEWGECDNPCAQAIRRRSVVCRETRPRDKAGRIAPDFMCDLDMEPASVGTCEGVFFRDCLLDPVWIVTSFGPCSLDCLGGYRTRTIKCQIPLTGENKEDSDCAGLIKPTLYEYCPITCCQGDNHPTFCKQAGVAKYCNLQPIQQECCWTCGLTSIP